MKHHCHFAVGYAGVNERGDVFPCCKFKKQYRLGNIHDRHLDDILADPATLRTKSIASQGKIPCFQGCTILTKEPIREKATIKTLYLRKNLNCNLRCTFCNQDHADMKRLSNELILARINFLHVEAVNILGGEPLLDKETLPLIEKLHETYKTRIIITTNGNFLDDKTCRILLRCCSEIGISLNGSSRQVSEGVMLGSNFEKTLDNIRRLVSMKPSDNKTSILLSQVITKNTLLDIKHFQSLAYELGVEPKFILDDNIQWPSSSKERLHRVLHKGKIVENEYLH